jgi:ATP-binding cassette subfamily B protein
MMRGGMGGLGGGGGGWRSFVKADEVDVSSKVTWGLVKRVMGYAKPYHMMIVGLLILITITTGLQLITPLIMRDLIDNTLPNKDMARLNILALGLITIPLVSGGLRVLQRHLNARIGEGVTYDLRVALYDHLQKMSLRFFTNTKTGELMSRLNNDVIDAQRAISQTIIDIVTNLITVITTLAVMLTMEWRLTILGVMVLPFFIFFARQVGSRLRDLTIKQMTYNAQMNAMMNETLNISGGLLVKLFGRRAVEVERFQDRASKVRDSGVDRAVIGAQFFVVVGLISAIGTALIYWVGGHLVLSDVLTAGTVIAFGAYLGQLYAPLQALTNIPVDFATSVVSFERVFEIIDLPLEIAEKPDAIVLDDVKGKVEFDNVTFVYDVDETFLLSEVSRRPDEDDMTLSGINQQEETSAPRNTQAREIALKNISFTMEAGQLVALVGPSGAGKTTTTYLIPRLYDPIEGVVRVDDLDIRDVSLDSLAEQIGMVTQEVYLFHDTIKNNLLYAKLDATQAELETACKAANIHNFIMDLPFGYDTIVGERGYRLSGGEKQRIALARVILKNPRILVLDEATSSLDSQSEYLIQEAMKTVMQGRTSLVIAHRLSTILAADKILVMNRGEVVEQGTHEELLALDGLYAELYKTQFYQQQIIKS